MKNIRFLTIILTLGLLFTMVACGDKKTNDDATTTNNTASEEVTTKEDVTTKKDDTTTEAPTTDGDGGEENTPTLKYPWATQGGDGTEADPFIVNQTNFLEFYEYYKIGSFEAFTTELEYFKLGSNIVLNEGNAADWATTAPTTVFTAPLSNFYGVFDGAGYSISGLYMKTPSNIYRSALFGEVYGTIKNLGVINSYIEVERDPSQNYYDMGAIAGRFYSGLIENCYSNAILNGTALPGSSVAGGIVGRISGQDTVISKCVFYGALDAGQGYAGGILGQINGQLGNQINNCLNLGVVKGTSCAGGIIGRDDAGGGSTSSMSNCANLSGEIYKGGVKANFIYGGGLSKYYLNNIYVIEEFSTDSTSANNTDGIVDGVADVYHTGYYSGENAHKINRMSLADFLALGGTANAPQGWYFAEGYVPTPIEGLQIAIPTAWSAYLA